VEVRTEPVPDQPAELPLGNDGAEATAELHARTEVVTLVMPPPACVVDVSSMASLRVSDRWSGNRHRRREKYG